MVEADEEDGEEELKGILTKRQLLREGCNTECLTMGYQCGCMTLGHQPVDTIHHVTLGQLQQNLAHHWLPSSIWRSINKALSVKVSEGKAP